MPDSLDTLNGPLTHSHLEDTRCIIELWFLGGEVIYQLRNLLPIPDPTAEVASKKPVTHFIRKKKKRTNPKNDDLSGNSRRSSTLRASPSTLTLLMRAHTHTHEPHPVWGHFTLDSLTSIFHLHNREGAAERRKALHEIIKDPAGMQQHSSRCPILSNRSNESCPSDH